MGVIATMYEQRVKDNRDLRSKDNVIGVVKKLAIAKKGVYGFLPILLFYMPYNHLHYKNN
ncbi:MAG TPA: hypothetical protein DHW61_04300 [Lachnoclostridium phytofermentans]|uniref:Uncharacterized protein n=1 Tax=Lachnoclostridium phytofermentans TaxID=66219 RepID=A0A3D2X4J3_9FIRM|nr:hypothetical protein [Lachnoclostridium phytofermentans]